jgi:hypothetical protein
LCDTINVTAILILITKSYWNLQKTENKEEWKASTEAKALGAGGQATAFTPPSYKASRR